MIENEVRITVLNAFLNLEKSLNILSKAILKDSDLIGWLEGQSLTPSKTEQIRLRKRAISAIQQLEYQNEQAPKEILVLAGFLGASPETLSAVAALNQAKALFKQSVLSMKHANISLKCPFLQAMFDAQAHKHSLFTQDTLKKVGLSRLHLKQCYRSLPILPCAPDTKDLSFSWTWANTRSIKKISHTQAQQLLEEKGLNEAIHHQILKLKLLHPKEELAIVRDLAPHLRANIRFTDHNLKEHRLMVKGPVPIFFPATQNSPWPSFKTPKPKKAKNKNRQIRADIKLEAEAYLPAIHVHRYIQAYRPIQ